MFVLAGLGNPGPNYDMNRHNVGFIALDIIREHYAFPPWRFRFHGKISEKTLDGKKYTLIKPQTFMNNSGRAIGEIMRFYKLSPADFIVLHDELDLNPGEIKTKNGGGNAGHNGLRSISEHIGAGYRRIRIGIGHPGDKAQVERHVLGNFTQTETNRLLPLLENLANNIIPQANGNNALSLEKLDFTGKKQKRKQDRMEKSDGI
ncbi:MAG: aminoacyl-tRNA hydrolase [Alphaproteobacteria bacterium]|nr:aminoacyl-tRNA hydrolase [Alphaproteobacteria bacterium]